MHALAARRPQLLAYGTAAALAVAVGAAIGVGGKAPFAFVGVALGLVLLPLFARFGRWKLPIWLALSGLLYPFLNYPAQHPVVTFDRVWICGMAVLMLSEVRPADRGARRSRRMWTALLVFAVVFGLRALLTTDGALRALYTWVDAILLSVFVFAVCRRAARSARSVRFLSVAVVVGGVVVALIGIAERIAGFELASRTGGAARFDANIGLTRVSGPYNAPEVFGLVLVLSLAATCFWILARRTQRAYVLGGAAVIIQLAAIAVTYFRVAWLAAAVVLLGAIALRPRRWVRLLGILALSLTLLYVALVQLESSSATVQDRLGNSQTVLARAASYEQGLKLFASNPLFGVGIKRYTPEAESRSPVFVGGVTSVPEPHSSFILVLAEQGIVGFASLLGVVVAAILLLRALGRRARAQEDVLLSVCLKLAALGYLMFSLTLGMLPYAPSNWLFAALLGLAAGRLDGLEARPAAPADDEPAPRSVVRHAGPPRRRALAPAAPSS